MAKNPTLGQRAVAEGLGAFLLLFLGVGSIIASGYFFPGSAQLLAVAVSFGLALALAVTIAMPISGGHINPAVTVAMFITGRIKAPDAVVYIVAQLIGAAVGVGILLMIPQSIIANSMLGLTTLNQSVGILSGIGIEAAITFVLVTAAFATTVDKRSPKIGGFGVGLALMLGILVAGPLTGAAANPARAFGSELVTMNFTNWFVYWIGPVAGAIIAALIYQYILLKDAPK